MPVDLFVPKHLGFLIHFQLTVLYYGFHSLFLSCFVLDMFLISLRSLPRIIDLSNDQLCLERDNA